MEGRIPPKDRSLDKRMVALGVVSFLALAGLFCLGLYGIGPLLRSYFPPQPEIGPPPAYVPPARTHEEPPAETEEPQVPDIEIRERGADGNAPAEEPGSSDEGVRQDESGLTVRLEPEDGSRPSTGHPGRPSTRPERRSRLPDDGAERPRASTEGKNRPASTASEKRAFRVDTGTFANKANAESLAADLESHGYKPEVKSVQMEDRTVYRVQLGGYKSREDAQELANDLSAKGYSPTVTEETSE